MDAQLEILLQIQDLKAQRQDLAESGSDRQVEEEAFHLRVDEAIGKLDEKIQELVDDLSPQIRKRYERLSGGVPRVVVPAINGICYGCFVAVPTSIASDPTERSKLRNCDHCSRFLYFVD
jgi:uncharacterized protein